MLCWCSAVPPVGGRLVALRVDRLLSPFRPTALRVQSFGCCRTSTRLPAACLQQRARLTKIVLALAQMKAIGLWSNSWQNKRARLYARRWRAGRKRSARACALVPYWAKSQLFFPGATNNIEYIRRGSRAVGWYGHQWIF